jgi:hypothetical protein
VEGAGGATILRDGAEMFWESGSEHPMSALGGYAFPPVHFGVRAPLWEEIRRRREEWTAPVAPPPEVESLRRERDSARRQGNFPQADALRRRMEDLGWTVEDTKQGSALRRM